jgi:hypothetical protein
VQASLIAEIFPSNKLVRLINQDGYKFFVRISGSGANTTTGIAWIDFDQDPLPLGSACVGGVMKGARAAPLSMMRYRLIDAGDAATDNPSGIRSEAVTGRNIQLVRQELDPADPDGNPLVSQAVLDHVVSFDVDFVLDTRNRLAEPPAAPVMTPFDDANAVTQVNANPEYVRTAIITLATRTPEMDTRFPWTGQVTAEPVTRYRFTNDNNKKGAARVRTLRAQIPVSTVAQAGL